MTLFRSVVLCGLSLSLGWGIRGNFGHSHGAMIPGALAALAAVLASGREDWWRRAGYFGMFGALGWAFGGRMSYMQVIAYTHSGHAPSQLYGFACLCVIGFLWAALGGAWTALPACLNREQLTRLFPPILAVLFAWFLKNLALTYLFPQPGSDRRHESPLYWHDTSWLDALVALGTLAVYAAGEFGVLRGRLTEGTRFLLYLAVGWWAAFLVIIVGMVDGLGINFRMTPPRGDDWVGTLGMTAGAFAFFLRNGMVPAARATLVTGLFGGAGFAGAAFLKLAEVRYVPAVLGHFFGESAWQTNWHSVLEQTYGLVNGVGVGVAMYLLAGETPPVRDEPRAWRWTEVAAAGFVLLLVTYVNVITDVPNWVGMKAVPPALYGVRTRVWFDAGYAVLAVAVLGLLVRHLRVPIAVVPASPLGKAQLLYLVLLWWVVVGNLVHAIPPFAEQRLITEGVIHVNAVVCSVLILVWPRNLSRPESGPGFLSTESTPVHYGDEKARFGGSVPRRRSLGATALTGLIVLAALAFGAFVGTRAMYGDRFAGQANHHVRFGPDAAPPLPKKGEKHP